MTEPIRVHCRFPLVLAVFTALLWPLAGIAAPQVVVTGVFLTNVNDIDMKTSVYTADFYVWFRWRGELDPTKSFELTNVVEKWGMTQDLIYEEPLVLPSGEKYQVVRIQGKFNRKFQLWDYPLDRQEVTISIEETRQEVGVLRYELDTRDTGFNPELQLPGWEIIREVKEVTDSIYKSHFGDVRRSGGEERYSRLTYGLGIERSRRAYMVRMLLPIAVILLSTFLAFFLLPEYVDARVGIVITSLLSIVALHLAEGTDLPNVGYLVLMDKVYNLSYLVILLALVETIFAIRLKDSGQIARARHWDRVSLFLLPSAFAVGLALLLMLR